MYMYTYMNIYIYIADSGSGNHAQLVIRCGRPFDQLWQLESETCTPPLVVRVWRGLHMQASRKPKTPHGAATVALWSVLYKCSAAA